MNEDSFKSKEGEKIRIRKNLWNIGCFLVEVLFLILLGPKLFQFFLPVVIAWLLAQLANPLVQLLEKRLHIVRKHSSVGIVVGTILLIVLLCYYLFVWLFRETVQLLEKLPLYYGAFMEGVEIIGENLQGFAEKLPPDFYEGMSEFTSNFTDYLGQIVGSLGGGTVEIAGNAAKNIPSLLIQFIFILLFAYFFIAERERLQKIAKRVLPQSGRMYLQIIWKKMKAAVGGYFLAQFKIMGIVAVILVIGFLILRVDYAVFLAAIIAFLDFLPMLGTGTVLIPWAIFYILSGAWNKAVGFLVLYAITQITRQLIQPKMVGDSVGIDTMSTLFLMFIGYRISGILGMILAIPTGLILIQFYEAGAFDFLIQNVKELMETIHFWKHPEEK